MEPSAPDTTAKVKELITPWPVKIQLPVQWGDQDALGHVNNVVYFRWFESARVELIMSLGLRADGELGTILAATQCSFLHPLTYPDEVFSCVGVLKLGRSSIRMAHQIISCAHGRVAAQGTATVVVFDYKRQHPVPIPQPLREKLQKLLLPQEISECFAKDS